MLSIAGQGTRFGPIGAEALAPGHLLLGRHLNLFGTFIPVLEMAVNFLQAIYLMVDLVIQAVHPLTCEMDFLNARRQGGAAYLHLVGSRDRRIVIEPLGVQLCVLNINPFACLDRKAFLQFQYNAATCGSGNCYTNITLCMVFLPGTYLSLLSIDFS